MGSTNPITQLNKKYCNDWKFRQKKEKRSTLCIRDSYCPHRNLPEVQRSSVRHHVHLERKKVDNLGMKRKQHRYIINRTIHDLKLFCTREWKRMQVLGKRGVLQKKTLRKQIRGLWINSKLVTTSVRILIQGIIFHYNIVAT